MPSRECCALPAGSSLNHCGACHETFSHLSLFDQHRAGDWPERSCTTPETLGYVKAPNGAWYTPEGLRDSVSKRERLSLARQARALAPHDGHVIT